MYQEPLFSITEFMSCTQCRIGAIVFFLATPLSAMVVDNTILPLLVFLAGLGFFILSFECKDNKEL